MCNSKQEVLDLTFKFFTGGIADKTNVNNELTLFKEFKKDIHKIIPTK